MKLAALLAMLFVVSFMYCIVYYVVPERNLAESLASQGKFDEATYHLVKCLGATILLLITVNVVLPSHKDK